MGKKKEVEILGNKLEEVRNPWRGTPFGKKEFYLRRKKSKHGDVF